MHEAGTRWAIPNRQIAPQSAGQSALENEVAPHPSLTRLLPPASTHATGREVVSCGLAPRIGADGYGLGARESAHRLAYREAHGPIPRRPATTRCRDGPQLVDAVGWGQT